MVVWKCRDQWSTINVANNGMVIKDIPNEVISSTENSDIVSYWRIGRHDKVLKLCNHGMTYDLHYSREFH